MQIFFDGWGPLGRVLIIGPLAYATLVLFLRISGKRTLTKLNAFDLVITVSLGSTLATAVLNKNTSLSEGILGFAVLIGLQYAVTWGAVRSPMVQRLVKSEPSLLLHRGEFLEGAMLRERVTRDELMSVLRASGKADPGEVAAVVLETDGSFSILADVPEHGARTLADLPRVHHRA